MALGSSSSLLVLVMVLRVAMGYPHGLSSPSDGCHPDPLSPLVERRALCPFTRVPLSAGGGLHTFTAVLDRECKGTVCGDGGECVPVMMRLLFSGQLHQEVAVAFVCALPSRPAEIQADLLYPVTAHETQHSYYSGTL